MIRLKCYEPPHLVLRFTADTLTRHVFAVGSTGCGKTTAVINPCLEQLITYQAADPQRKVGLLILDPKGDNTPQRVLAWATQAQRQDDVLILSAQGDAYFNPLAGFERLDQVEEFARRMLSGTGDIGPHNQYWTEFREGLINSALTILLACGKPVEFLEALSFMRAWWLQSSSDELKQRVEFVRRLLKEGTLAESIRLKLDMALEEIQTWKSRDSRLRDNHRSTLLNALRPLASAHAQQFFDPRKPCEFRAPEVLNGKLLVVSINALTAPPLASLIFKLVKRDFFHALQNRGDVALDRERLCGFICDEYYLSAEPEDAEHLATYRSRGGFVVAATQSLSALDQRVGRRVRDSLLNNFNSVLAMRSQEREIDEFVGTALGVRHETFRSERTFAGFDFEVGEIQRVDRFRPLCPPGSLARLESHQAFVWLADGTRPLQPVWLEPKFMEIPPPVATPESEDELSREVQRLLKADAEVERERVGRMLKMARLLHDRGKRMWVTPPVLEATWKLCETKKKSYRFKRLRAEFENTLKVDGVWELPDACILGFMTWMRQCETAQACVTEVLAAEGIMCLKVADSIPARDFTALMLQISLNQWIYPSLWKPLKKRHFQNLWADQPDLRGELATLPQAGWFLPPHLLVKPSQPMDKTDD